MIGSMRFCRLGRLCLGVMSGLLLGLCLVPAGPALADEPTELRESLSAGTCTQVRIELKAEGLFRPGLSSGALAAEATMPKPLALDVQTRLVFTERLLGSGAAPVVLVEPGGKASPDRPPGQRPEGRRFVGSLRRLPRSMARSGPRQVACVPVSRCSWPSATRPRPPWSW